MTNLQDKIAALKAGDYESILRGTPDEWQMYVPDAREGAAKVIVLEEQVRVLREALEECWRRINVGVEYEEAGLQPDSYSYTYGGVKDKVNTALAATDMGE